MTTLLLIPPDTRPPTLEHPVQLARMAGAEVHIPPPEALPYFHTPGDTAALAAWLEQQAAHADTLIVCLETLTLGGMIPARRVDDSLEVALERLTLLERLHAAHPKLCILAFGVVVRVAHDNDPHEEKPYYGEWGAALRAYSTARDRVERHGETERPALEAARAAVPAHILADWTGTRERNHRLHLRALDLLKSGTLAHLCLTLDDTSDYGLAALDRRALEARADALGVWERFDCYPGADEVPATLVARALLPHESRVYVRYSGTLGASAGLIYEDRPAGELVRAHLRAARCRPVTRPEDAEFILAVNTPGVRQANVQPDYGTVDTPQRHLPAFLDDLRTDLAEGRAVSVADIAYPNGAERRLWQLMQPLPLAALAGYAAWNTAGNTLGSAIAFGRLAALVSTPERRRIQTQALFARFVDDALYQSFVRTEVRSRLHQPSPYDLAEQRQDAEAHLDTLLTPQAQALWARHFANSPLNLHWDRPRLAWPRLFTGEFPFEVEHT
ncbi:DUF4127 family protein (plasmid) [Deinococcus sp. KNUC1210]|uniref:DUF4127 family protein n=1 Tax=Deinococcus sp. KNUC1210 TaxID=2917691 RepID=UPI001EF00EB1|nr:DUF4127 family protein [Deinococcus sp. KNUC1210]ULH14275.1 DUF4127 family protein [Deinococcus sp. KNUC1210]